MSCCCVLSEERRPVGRGLVLFLFLALATAGCTNGSSGTEVVRLDRGTFHVDVTETQTTADGNTVIPDPNVAEILITRSLVQHGFTRAPDAASARYVIEGKCRSWYWRPLTFQWEEQEVLLEHQFKARFEGTVTDRAASGGARSVAVSVPEGYYGRTDMKQATRDSLRKIGSDASHAIVNCELLQVPEVTALIDALADENEQRTFNEITAALVAVGGRAVPYLLDALRDDREVKIAGEYPGLEMPDAEAVRYVHVADQALSEILSTDSGFELESDEGYELRIIVGWTWHWEDIQGIPDAYRTYPEERKDKRPADLQNR